MFFVLVANVANAQVAASQQQLLQPILGDGVLPHRARRPVRPRATRERGLTFGQALHHFRAFGLKCPCPLFAFLFLCSPVQVFRTGTSYERYWEARSAIEDIESVREALRRRLVLLERCPPGCGSYRMPQ